MWEERMQSGMVQWLMLLAETIDAASCNPGELANVRRDTTLERATGTASTIHMTSEDIAEACQWDVRACATANASPELAVVAELFDD
jgi:hypothetical protein